MSVVLLGSTSGSITLQEPAVAGTNTVNFGANTGVAILDANTPAFRNRILNGGMVIDQRKAGASTSVTSSDYFSCDRWQQWTSQSGKYTVQRSSTAPTGFVNSMLATSSSAYAVLTGDYFAFSQQIEGNNVADLAWGTASAATVTLSFWVRSSLTGTFGGAVSNSAVNRSYPFSYTINSANTYEQKTITIAGDTSGTWLTDTGIGLRLWFGFGVGATYSGTAGSWAGADYRSATGATSVVGTNGATFYITGVQLEKGSTATSFDYRSYGTELNLCQRYLPAFLGNTNTFGFGIAGSSTGFYCSATFPVTTRVAPTGITVSSASDFNGTDVYAQNAALSAVAFGSAGTTSALLSCTISGGLTAARPTTMVSNSSNSKLLFTGCEL